MLRFRARFDIKSKLATQSRQRCHPSTRGATILRSDRKEAAAGGKLRPGTGAVDLSTVAVRVWWRSVAAPEHGFQRIWAIVFRLCVAPYRRTVEERVIVPTMAAGGKIEPPSGTPTCR